MALKIILGSIICLGATFAIHSDHGFFDLKKIGQEQYQDIYSHGHVISKASYKERFEDQRFEIVDSILRRYHRPFTLLDIGAAQGYFSFRAAEKYPSSSFVMLEGSNEVYPMISKQLRSICELNNYLKNVIWLDRKIEVREIEHLSTCEHFDVTLMLNILHWFPQDWLTLAKAVQTMSHIAIFEVPPIEEDVSPEQKSLRQQIHRYLAEMATEIRPGVPRHNNLALNTTYYIVENQKPFALKTTSLMHPDYGDRRHFVHFNYDSKTMKKIDLEPPFATYEADWIPGINLMTYLAFNGAHPKRENIVKKLPRDPRHRDWMPNNMVLQGETLALIDLDDAKNEPGGKGTNPCNSNRQEKIERLITKTTNQTKDEVKESFFEFLKTLGN